MSKYALTKQETLFDMGPEPKEPLFDGRTYDPVLDEDRLKTQLERVYCALYDGKWHTLAELQKKCGGSEAGISARVRDLRKPRFGSNKIERKRRAGGLWTYRMVRNAEDG